MAKPTLTQAGWSYSSARIAYAALASGGASWWYRYAPKVRGTYAFRVRFPARPDRLESLSKTIAVTVR